MADTYFSMRNVQFVLYEVMKAEGLCSLPRFEEHSREIFDMVLETGKKLCDGTLYPALKEMDLSAPAFKDGRITVSPVVRELMRECGEGGWIGAHANFDRGGQQLPDTVLAALRFMFSASNYSASVYPFLSSGAAQCRGPRPTFRTYEQILINPLTIRWRRRQRALSSLSKGICLVVLFAATAVMCNF